MRFLQRVKASFLKCNRSCQSVREIKRVDIILCFETAAAHIKIRQTLFRYASVESSCILPAAWVDKTGTRKPLCVHPLLHLKIQPLYFLFCTKPSLWAITIFQIVTQCTNLQFCFFFLFSRYLWNYRQILWL